MTEKRIFYPLLQKYCNFANFWSWALKFLQESDLVLIPSNPRSFYHPMIFGTPSGHNSGNFQDFYPKMISFFGPKNLGDFQNYDQRGYENSTSPKRNPRNERFRTRSDSCQNLSVQLQKFAKLQYFWQSGKKIRFSGLNSVTRSLRTESC